MTKAEAHMFHISSGRLEALRSLLHDHVPSEIRLSDNDLIASLASMAIANGFYRKPSSGNGLVGRVKSACASIIRGLFGNTTTEHLTFLIVDTRHRLGISMSGYTGNCVIPQLVINQSQRMGTPITPEAHAHVACRVRAAVQDFDRPYISQFIRTLNEHPSSFAQPLVYSINHPERVFVTNQSRFPLYSLNFGFGTPTW
ncbi:hypothetical protein GGI20_006293, partial [Coemansia sp. BCRC 34301]